MATGEAVQRRLADNIQSMALRTDIHVVQAPGTAAATQAYPVEQIGGFQPVLLQHQLQPAEGIEAVIAGQRLDQRVAIMLGTAGVAHGTQLRRGTQPQPGQHAAFQALGHAPAVEQGQAFMPGAP